jgi:threonyl-tRNA synthetase
LSLATDVCSRKELFEEAVNNYLRTKSMKLIFTDKEMEPKSASDAEKALKKAKALAVADGDALFDTGAVGDLMDRESLVALTFDSDQGKDIYRHSVSHLMAHAVKELFPSAKVAIGPSIENGFYYDFDVERPFTPEDLTAIEKKMSQLIKKSNPFVRKEMSRAEAIELFKGMGEDYKVELIEELTDETVSIYDEGGFVDLCRGPHVPNTNRLSSFKLLSVAGAYWRGDEKNKMLQRIYGTAFADKDSLKAHLDLLEEIKKRDHRRLGKDLDLFSINDEIGPGLVLWHPNGAKIRKTIEDFWGDEHEKAGYDILYTPHIAKLDLWHKSGHSDFYSENMYSPMDVDGQAYEVKPMNCPFHIAVYKSQLRSYRDLPIKYAELGTVYRYERSGVLHGLLRVRGFTQDDAHLFITQDQVEAEIQEVLDFVMYVLKTFGFEDFDIYLSTRPEKSVGDDESWQVATDALESALKANGLPFEFDPGEGVFYGPKIDIKVKDSLGRSWQCSTIQVDFNLPERFDVSYRGADGNEHRPIMIHRALMGSLERFFGILIEHYAGVFPLWLAPEQVRILTIADRHADYAKEVLKSLKAGGIRATADLDNQKVGYKIREATVRKVPYLVIIGDNELEDKNLTIRLRSGENQGPYTVEEFLDILNKKIDLRR